MRVIIIENELQSQETLMNLISQYCPQLQVVAAVTSISEACQEIVKADPQLIFLDVELNNESGFDLFKSFPAPSFEVIFTTAHQEYAIRAIKCSCLDYLLKPIEYRELQAAVSKAGKKNLALTPELLQTLLHNLVPHANQRLSVPSINGYEFIDINDIVLAEADGNYTKLYTTSSQLLSSKTLGEYESLLSDQSFFRCHKSYLINWQYIERFDRNENQVHMKGGIKVDLAVRKKEEFLARLKK